ncbi:hypothetical protein [Novosphingobium sp. KA1]|uniref:hypothetical protein n=1 Tax=Novosphingobium sp. (strain KA1) TaxID=164608 RepID=UPI001A8DC45B|nr:hypothetical protein [Novosphingobium sp. KA1]QSR17179.1 hypothetical protein CA833_08265 [Novosphingobium sp. KA1]
MQVIGYLLAGFLILGLIGAAVKLLVILAIAGVIIGFIVNPRESIGMIALLAIIGLVTRFPLPGAMIILALCIVGTMSKAGNVPS